MNRAAWLEERRTYIGASDAANLIGVGFQDEHAVYREKVEGIDPAAPVDPLLTFGLEMEPIIAARYCEAMKISPVLLKVGRTERSKLHPWQAANPDRLDVSPVLAATLVELKAPLDFGDEWGPSGSDVVPDKYRVQVVQQMGVLMPHHLCDDRATISAVARRTGEFRVFHVTFDVDLFFLLTEVEQRFWTDHVQPQRPPGPEWAERFGEPVRKRLVRPDLRLELPDLAADLVARRQQLVAVRDEADEEVKAVNAALLELMGEARTAKVPGFTLTQVQTEAAVVPAHTRRGYTSLRVTKDREAKR